ncbi:hypothetical protein ScPMuIL_013342 [Solemya velum]
MLTSMAYSCANTTGRTDDKSVIFTRIPATPDHVTVECLTRLHREDIDPKKFLPGKNHVLCSRNFDERCFEIDMALKLMKGVEKRKFKDTTTIVPIIFSHVRPTAARPNTEQLMAKKPKDKMMDQLLHGLDDPNQAFEEACLVAVENIQPPAAKRPRPKSRCKWPTLVDAETQTEVVIMCDGETQVERTSTTGVEATSSLGMEKVGLDRCIDNLKDDGSLWRHSPLTDMCRLQRTFAIHTLVFSNNMMFGTCQNGFPKR